MGEIEGDGLIRRERTQFMVCREGGGPSLWFVENVGKQHIEA